MKWAIINSLPLVSSEDPSLKVWALIFFLISLHPFPGFLLSIFFLGMLLTFLSKMIILVRVLDLGSSSMSSMSSFRSPLLLMTSCRKVLMFLKRMSFIIGWTCPRCLCQRLESHFEYPKSFIYSPSRPSLRSM
jgi:hypothetical protein